MVRFLRSNVILALVAAIAVLALLGAVVSLSWLGRVQDDRENDRVNADVASCQRGNRNRAEQSDQIRTAIEGAVEEVATFAGAEPQEIAGLHLVVSDRLTADVIAIVTECADVVPGADPEVENFPQEGP